MAAQSYTNRRAFVTALAALPATAAPALAAGPNPDAELVRLGREWRQQSDYLATLEAEALPEPAWDALCAQRGAIEQAIIETPATGLAGLEAKATAAAEYLPDIEIEAVRDLIEEVLRLAGRAA